MSPQRPTSVLVSERDEKPRLSLRFAWYDLWIGVFVDTAKRTVYICPLPCVLITWRRRG